MHSLPSLYLVVGAANDGRVQVQCFGQLGLFRQGDRLTHLAEALNGYFWSNYPQAFSVQFEHDAMFFDFPPEFQGDRCTIVEVELPQLVFDHVGGRAYVHLLVLPTVGYPRLLPTAVPLALGTLVVPRPVGW